MVHKWKVRVDRERKTITLPGTWSTLILALLIFSVRYSFGVYYALHPTILRPIFLADLTLSGFIAGMFVGRALNFWNRYENLE